MTNNMIFLLIYLLTFSPFVLLVFLNAKSNVSREIRCRQYLMPIFAVIFCLALALSADRFSQYCLWVMSLISGLFETLDLPEAAETVRILCEEYTASVLLVTVNVFSFTNYVIFKRLATLSMRRREVAEDSIAGSIISYFYEFDSADQEWYIREHFGQARTFLKVAYYGGSIAAAVVMLISCYLYHDNVILTPYYPVFAVIIIGELAFFTDGLCRGEREKGVSADTDHALKIAMYPLLRKPLRAIFGDKLYSEGTTINHGAANGGAVEDVLTDIEEKGGHIGKNYATFMRHKMLHGLKPNIDYVRSGYDLACGRSLLFNTPFYDKLIPYTFYAVNRSLLTGGKVLIVLGRHGTEQDLTQWCQKGIVSVTNVPNLWKISQLTEKAYDEDNMPDIGIISRSGVHDLKMHQTNLPFLKKVDMVVIIEPSRLVTTAQIGLNLLIKCCGQSRKITFCSVDQNCDGLVDSLSHILMTNITEVSATEYPHGINSFMCWKADGDYLQHRIMPGVSRYLGMGTELSFVALKNQIEKTAWYGGEKYPVLDARWIAKQYYHDLLDYAKLPTTQEMFEKSFETSFNMCNEHVSDYSYVTVEDERNNVFEMKRNFATIAEQQGFVNVISTEYMLREYMTDNTELFNADPKAIPYITADYARTNRNAVLTMCLKLCVDGVTEKELCRELMLMGIDSRNPLDDLWNVICGIFCGREDEYDRTGCKVITATSGDSGAEYRFTRDETLKYMRKYSVELGEFESIYSIRNDTFAGVILNDLQNAGYIAERDSGNCYIGTELKGHIYQKYLPGQFFTLNGKYYEMVSVTPGNEIIIRRASDHISGRRSYRQVRNYTIEKIADSSSMGTLKTINQIDIYTQIADFSVETPAYWEMNSYQDFANGALTEINGIPRRRYCSKQILKLDFSRLGDAFTDQIRKTMTVLLNEVFVTLFADNQPFISAVTPGLQGLPLTYTLELETETPSDQCIYILEDSQMDLGLLIAVERNLTRIFQILSDYLAWNEEKIQESRNAPAKKNQRRKTLKDYLRGEEIAAEKQKESEKAEEQTAEPVPVPLTEEEPEPEKTEPAESEEPSAEAGEKEETDSPESEEESEEESSEADPSEEDDQPADFSAEEPVESAAETEDASDTEIPSDEEAESEETGQPDGDISDRSNGSSSVTETEIKDEEGPAADTETEVSTNG